MMLQARSETSSRESAAAFTLIELIVTIGIMALVMSVTIVAFTSAFRTASLRSAAQTLRAAVDGARIRAVQQRRQVRFEAQLMPGTTTSEWRVAASAGDTNQEWKALPQFIMAQTNLGSSGRGDYGLDGDFSVSDTAKYGGSSQIQRISVTFAPDGSVVRYAFGPNSDPSVDPQGKGTFNAFTNKGQTDEPFAVRLTNVRDRPRGLELEDLPHAELVILPLTGGLQAYDEGS